MRFVLNLPLPSYQGEQALGCSPLGAQAGDAIDYLYPFLARFGEHDVASKFKNLREPGPIAVAYERRTRRDIALLEAPMAKVDRLRRSLAIPNGRKRKDQCDISPQVRLVCFDDHDIIAALFDNRLRDVALGQEGVHRDNTPFEDQVLQESLDSRDLIGFVINSVLGEGDAHMMRQRR